MYDIVLRKFWFGFQYFGIFVRIFRFATLVQKNCFVSFFISFVMIKKDPTYFFDFTV